MNRTPHMLALLAAAALAGCNKEDHTIVAGGPADDDANRVAANANVELPPSIASSKIYRCKDNSVVYVDWMSDNKTANVRAGQAEAPVQLKAEEAGQPMLAEDYSLTGEPGASSVTLMRPGKGSQSCKA
ncbi:MAG: hypothetical protein H0U83_01345 [Sphingomonas sp.]|nr:hypothetical protein [Sphingomonas sp.]